MSALERLFLLEVEFHRRLRTDGLAAAGGNVGVRTSYALQCGYEELVRAVGPVRTQDIEQLRERMSLTFENERRLLSKDKNRQGYRSRLLDNVSGSPSHVADFVVRVVRG